MGIQVDADVGWQRGGNIPAAGLQIAIGFRGDGEIHRDVPAARRGVIYASPDGVVNQVSVLVAVADAYATKPLLHAQLELEAESNINLFDF